MAVRAVTGFEFGSSAGWATGNAGNKIFDAITGTPTISTTSPRTGTYCLEVSATAATEAAAWTTGTVGASQTRCRVVFAIYLPSLPSADTILAQLTISGSGNAQFRYNNDTGKFNIGFEGVGEVQDGPTAVASTWTIVEIYFQVNANPHTVDWWINGSAQSQATHAVAADETTGFEFGCSTDAQTFTARYDDAVIATDTAAIASLGSQRVVALTPDTGGSLDVSTINTAEWQTFAGATPTLSAWNATTALAAVAERPVDLGASADGFCRITGTDADFVGIPMTTETIAAGEVVTGLRMLACCWAQTTTAASLSLSSYNGTTATTLFAAADPNADNSSTVPAWVCKMATLADVDSQAELNALQFRLGVTDSTPDIGLHAIYAEVAIAEAVSGDATASPQAIAVTAALPQPAADVVAGPAAIAATVSSPAPALNVVAGPTAVAAVGALPQAQAVVPDVTVVPAVVAATVGIAQPAVNVVTGPSVLATSVALARADVNVAAGPTTIVTTVTVPRPGVVVVVDAVAVVALAVLPRPNVNVAAGPAVLAVVAGLDRPSVEVVAGPAVLAATVALARPDINTAVGVFVIAAVVALPTPTVLAGGDTAVSPSVIAAVVALTQPAVGVTVAPAVIAVVAVVASLIPPESGHPSIVSTSLIAPIVSTSLSVAAVTATTYSALLTHTDTRTEVT